MRPLRLLATRFPAPRFFAPRFPALPVVARSRRASRLFGIVLLAAAATTLASGCVYRMNIQQGNFLEAKAVDQVKVGMTRSQVRFLLGTPMVADAFQPNRWDYLYYLKDGRSRKVQQRHFVIHFEEEKVARIDRPEGEFQDPTLPTSPGA